MNSTEKKSKADELNHAIHEVMAGLKEHYPSWPEYQNMMSKLASVSKELNEIRTSEIKGELNEYKETI